MRNVKPALYSAPVGLAIDGRLVTDLARELSMLPNLRAACAQAGAEAKMRNLDRIIVHCALGFAARNPSNAAEAASRKTVLGDLDRRGFVPNPSVTAMLTAALANDEKCFGSSEDGSVPKQEVASDLDDPVPMLRPDPQSSGSGPIDLLLSTVSTHKIPAHATASDLEVIGRYVEIRPARALLMSVSELVSAARDFDRQIERHHARGEKQAAQAALYHSNLLALSLGAWHPRSGHEAVERIDYLAAYPGVFEAKDNFRTMLRAVVAQDALNWDITISRLS